MSTLLNIAEASDLLRKSVKTLQRWDRDGILKARRTPTNRRIYDHADLLKFLGMSPKEQNRRIVAYCRVSSQAQKPDLKNQRRVIEDFCIARGFAGVDYIEEIGGGLNFKRKCFIEMVDDVIRGNIKTLVIAHRDRLARFGFDLLSHLCQEHECELLVIDSEKVSPEQEMVQDLMTIVHCFSSRLYGLRNYRKALKKALTNPADVK